MGVQLATNEILVVEDDEVDAIYDQVFRELLTYMAEDPRTITRATRLLWVAHNLERVVFVVTGKKDGRDRGFGVLNLQDTNSPARKYRAKAWPSCSSRLRIYVPGQDDIVHFIRWFLLALLKH